MSRSDDENDGQGTERVVIRDRRKIDVKGKDTEVAKQAEDESAGGAHRAAEDEPAEEGVVIDTPALGAELEALRTELEERTRDLQRVTAEYVNYRKRVDRDRSVASEQTTGTVLTALLPVLDDVDRARQHGDLTGAFKAVADQLEATLEKLGLSPYGAEGDPFDPTLHEAVASQPSPAVTEPTCVAVLRRGYKLGERILRVPLVAVAEPSGEPAGAQDSAEPPAEWFGDEQRPE